MPTRPLLDRLRSAVGDAATGEPIPAPQGIIRAAVLILADASDAALPLFFITRAEDLRRHAGQVAFPGGRSHDGESATETALREAAEEVGLDPANVEIIGTLAPRLTAISQMWLTPVVGVQRGPWTVQPDGIEVAATFRVTLDRLLTTRADVRELTRDGVTRHVPFYTVEDHVIWGVTGEIVADLIGRLAATV